MIMWLSAGYACLQTLNYHDDFIDSGEGLTTLHLKLAEGLLAHFRDDRNNNKHHSQKRLLITQEQLNGCDRLPRGRQVLNSMWHELTSGVYTTTVFTWFTLAKVQLHGNNLGGFEIAWFSDLNEIEIRPDEPSLMEMFLTQIRRTSITTADLQSVDHLPLSHADKCYVWLVAVVQKHVLQHNEKQLVHEYTRQAGQPYLTFPGQADNPMLRRLLLSRGADLLRDVGFHLAGVRVQVVENESLHQGAETTGLILDLLAVSAKAVHVTTDLIRVHTQWVGLTN